MGVFDDTDAAMLSSAFETALTNYGVAKAGDVGKKQKVDTTEVDKPVPNTKTDISPSAIDKSGKTSDQIKKETNALKKAMQMPGKAIDVYDGALGALSARVTPVLNQYNDIQAAYGGLNVDLDKAVGSSKAVIDRLQSMQKYYYNVGNAGVEMSKKLGYSNNITSKYFENEAEAFNESEKVLGMLVDQHSQYINQLDEETLVKLPFYVKALGISSRDVAESVERSINSTGTAQTTMLDDIGKFAQGLEKTTGVPLKAIAQNAVQISNDTQRMGDVTAEEATRIAATLGQLGQTYDSFTSVLDKFQEFGSSAETSGLISQITGGAVNLDAQQLMYLASEEQEKFLPELRRSLLGGGFTKEVFENMANAEQRQFASALSMDREQVRSLLDTSRAFSETDLIDQQGKIAADKTDGFKAVTDQMELLPKYTDDSTKNINYLRTQGIIPLQQDLLLAGEEYSKLNTQIRDNIKLTDQAAMTTAERKLVQGQGDMARAGGNQIEEPTNIGLTGEGGIFSQDNAYPTSQQSAPSNTSFVQPPANESEPVQSNESLISDLHAKQIPILLQQSFPEEVEASSSIVQPISPAENNQKVIEKLAAVEATQVENAAKAGTNNEATDAQIAALTTALQEYTSNVNSSKEIILNVDKSELGRILIDSKFIVNGAPTSLVKTATA